MKQKFYPILFCLTLLFSNGYSFDPYRVTSTPVEGTTTFDNLYSGSFNDLTGIQSAGSGLTASDVDGYDITLYATSSVVDCGIGIEPFTGQTAMPYGYTETGATNLSMLDVSSNGGEIFDLQSVDITIDGSATTTAKNIQLVGYKNGNPVSGAILTEAVLGASYGGLLVTFDVSTNANFVGIDMFRIQTDGTYTIDGAIGIDNVNAINFRSGTLPIALLSYSSKILQNNTVLLNWSSAQETNNNFYQIERSQDGVSFNNLGEVKSIGNNTGNNNYHFTDMSPLNGQNFYRLSQTDLDGKTKYLGIVKASLKINNRINIYPNPVSGGRITMRLNYLPTSGAQYELVDISGKRMQVGVVSSQLQLIDISKLSQGTYVLRLSNGDAAVFEKK